MRQGHDPEWPDKVVFAGLTLLVAGAAGLAFVGIQASTATVRELIPGMLGAVPAWLTASLCVATIVFAALAIRHQAGIWVMVGAITAIGSMGIYGVVPVLAVIAVALLVLGWREGEELAHDERRVAPDEWPDKAFMASGLLMVAGIITVAEGILVLAGRFEPLVLGQWETVAGLWGLVTGATSLLGAVACFRLRAEWLGALGGVAAIVGAGLYVIGPVLGLLALEYLRRAYKEDEFQAAPGRGDPTA